MKQILVVDDEFDVQVIFEQEFDDEIARGIFSFAFVHSGEEALTYLRSQAESDLILILTDVNMPNMTGFELLQVIKTERPDRKVVMITAYDDAPNREKAKMHGAEGFFAKPISFPSIKDIVMQYSNTIENHTKN